MQDKIEQRTTEPVIKIRKTSFNRSIDDNSFYSSGFEDRNKIPLNFSIKESLSQPPSQLIQLEAPKNTQIQNEQDINNAQLKSFSLPKSDNMTKSNNIINEVTPLEKPEINQNPLKPTDNQKNQMQLEDVKESKHNNDEIETKDLKNDLSGLISGFVNTCNDYTIEFVSQESKNNSKKLIVKQDNIKTNFEIQIDPKINQIESEYVQENDSQKENRPPIDQADTDIIVKFSVEDIKPLDIRNNQQKIMNVHTHEDTNKLNNHLLTKSFADDIEISFIESKNSTIVDNCYQPRKQIIKEEIDQVKNEQHLKNGNDDNIKNECKSNDELQTSSKNELSKVKSEYLSQEKVTNTEFFNDQLVSSMKTNQIHSEIADDKEDFVKKRCSQANSNDENVNLEKIREKELNLKNKSDMKDRLIERDNQDIKETETEQDNKMMNLQIYYSPNIPIKNEYLEESVIQELDKMEESIVNERSQMLIKEDVLINKFHKENLTETKASIMMKQSQEEPNNKIITTNEHDSPKKILAENESIDQIPEDQNKDQKPPLSSNKNEIKESSPEKNLKSTKSAQTKFIQETEQKLIEETEQKIIQETEEKIIQETEQTMINEDISNSEQYISEKLEVTPKPIHPVLLRNSNISEDEKNEEYPLSSKNKVYIYGSAECDQFDFSDFESKRPIEIPFFSKNKIKISKIACGSQHSLVLSSKGIVYSWGNSDDGALGRRSDKGALPAKVSIPEPIDLISAGEVHSTFANSKSMNIYFSGVIKSIDGKAITPIVRPRIVVNKNDLKKPIDQLISGNNHILVRCLNKVYSFGDNSMGQLGYVLRSMKRENRKICINYIKIKNVSRIFTGADHSFAISNNTQLMGWGLNSLGQLGLPYYIDNPEDSDVNNIDPSINPNVLQLPQLIPFDKTDQIKQIKGGDHHSLILLNDGSIYGSGRNDEGQLAEFIKPPRDSYQECKTSNQYVKIPGKRESIKITNDYMPNSFFKLPITKPFQKILSKSHYNYGINSTEANFKKIYSWGSGFSFVLGDGREEGKKVPFRISNNKLFKRECPTDLALGHSHVLYFSGKKYDLDLNVIHKKRNSKRKKIVFKEVKPNMKRVKK